MADRCAGETEVLLNAGVYEMQRLAYAISEVLQAGEEE